MNITPEIEQLERKDTSDVSIYGTSFGVGDPRYDEDTPGVVLIRDNGTNHYPSLALNRRGSIDGAEIPSWCVPGHTYDDVPDPPGYDAPGSWYRLCCFAIERGPEHMEMLLDPDAATALRDDLTRWLEKPKTTPTEAKT